MKTTDGKQRSKVNFTEKLKARALELLDESHAKQFVEGLRVSSAMANVFDREQKRIKLKYGDDHPRHKEIVARLEASNEAKTTLFARYSDAVTPQTKSEKGWAVDGFVHTATGEPIAGAIVAAYDKNANKLKEFGSGTTDERGFFSIKVDKLSEKLAEPVFMRASIEKKLLDSNEVQLTPTAGSSERIEIIVKKTDGKEKREKDDTIRPDKKPPTPITPPAPAKVKEKTDKPAVKTGGGRAASAKTPTAKKSSETAASKRPTIKTAAKAKPPAKAVKKAKPTAKSVKNVNSKKVTKAAKPSAKKTVKKKSRK